MKKSIFICMPTYMELGGIESSLIGLLDAIDYKKYEVDLFLYGHRGPLFNYINKNVNLLPEEKNLAYIRNSIAEKVKYGAIYSAWRRVCDGLYKLSIEESWGKIVKRKVANFDKEYDIALGFFLPFDVISQKVKAKIRLGWIHTDYTQHKASKEYLKKAYASVDYQVAVSEAGKETFIKLFPEFSDTTITIENILSRSYINELSNKFDAVKEMPETTLRLLTVGRFSYPKRIEDIPEICKLILETGLKVKWYIIGYGGSENLIKQKIAEFDMQNNVILLGKKENPYPYLKACDVYVQPSRYEGKCVAVREAQMFCKPVVITKYPTSSSQLEDGVDGIIVPMDIKGCADGIVKVLRDKDLQKRLSENCKKRDYSNANEIEKVYTLMKGETN